MSHALYELALNQHIQDKLREEINQEYTNHGSNMLYDDIKKMNYLDKVFKGTLFNGKFNKNRKYAAYFNRCINIILLLISLKIFVFILTYTECLITTHIVRPNIIHLYVSLQKHNIVSISNDIY